MSKFELDEAVYKSLEKASTAKRRYRKKPPADEQEAFERAEAHRTQGREGCKMPRINLGLSPTNYQFVKIMAGVTGQSMAAFIDSILDRERMKPDVRKTFEACARIKAAARGEISNKEAAAAAVELADAMTAAETDPDQ